MGEREHANIFRGMGSMLKYSISKTQLWIILWIMELCCFYFKKAAIENWKLHLIITSVLYFKMNQIKNSKILQIIWNNDVLLEFSPLKLQETHYLIIPQTKFVLNTMQN